MMTFRARLLQYVVSWLKNTNAARLLYTFGLHLDVTADFIRAAVRKRFLEPDSYDALALHGEMRKMPRGPEESDENYASRLPGWLDAHRIRGNAWGMLEQLWLYFQPSPFVIELFQPSGLHYTLNVDGTIDWTLDGPVDVELSKFARWTLVLHWPAGFGVNPDWDTPAGNWDDDGGIWDSALLAVDAAVIRTIPEAWNAGHAQGTIIVLAPGAATWDYPTSIWDDGGTWDSEGAGGIAWLYTS